MNSIVLVAAFSCLPQGAPSYHVDLTSHGVDRPAWPVIVRTPAPQPIAVPWHGSMLPDDRTAGEPIAVQVDPVVGDPHTIELSWLQPPAQADLRGRWALILSPPERPNRGPWSLHDGDPRTLSLHGATVWEQPTRFDPDDLESTKKTYQHLYSPDGKVRLTKGLGGLYPHHRGLFAGWNHTTAGDRTFDFWHATGGVSLRDRGVVASATTTGIARATVTCRIDWVDADGKPIVHEQRTLTTWDTGEHRRVLDLAVALTPERGKVTLDGDPHHAGVQLRLAQECAERNDVTYLRPKDTEAQGNDVWNGGDWVAARATIEKRPFVVLWLTDPDDHEPRVWSTRPYGRFGPFTRLELPAGTTRTLRYRLVIFDADGDDAEIEKRVHDEVAAWQHPLQVTVEPANRDDH